MANESNGAKWAVFGIGATVIGTFLVVVSAPASVVVLAAINLGVLAAGINGGGDSGDGDNDAPPPVCCC
jgi:hypothetical protein